MNPVTMKNCMALRSRFSLLRFALAVGMVLIFALLSRAGGPKYVAGTSYFDASSTGQPLTWPLGQITYYTDQGDLSPILPNSSANTFVANAFSVWTSVPTAAIAATSGGQLAEDVNGTNVYVNSDGTITMPADIQPSATGTPVGVVYDYDGSVTDALLGAGAGDSSQCFSNAVYGGNDNFGALASFQHALIVINGQCALESSQLVDVEYRLVRVIGTVYGLDWSQLNPNVVTGDPPATAADYAGFPVMHYTDPTLCVPITNCYPNPYQPTADDMAAISRLYPVTTQNQANYANSQLFSSSTARIHGTVWFTNSLGNSTQPMQGVNVVARWINPATGQPSRQYAVSSVSGFLFVGNAGNPVTGLDDALGNPYSEWGSTSASSEGFFDLSGLAPPGSGTAQYQLSVEALDPIWSEGVGPYAPLLVAPSGSFQPVTVSVAPGQDVEQDILMTATAQPIPQPTSEFTWTNPGAIPSSGSWAGSLSGYGDVPYFQLTAQANRTLSVAVTALDESGNASDAKAQPVVGMWPPGSTSGSAPSAFTTSSFNTVNVGMTRLDAQIGVSGNFLIGISDLRGDGRPDYHYHAYVLYADSVSPPRLGVNGGPITITGTGFTSNVTATVAGTPVPVLASSPTQIVLAAPVESDSQQNIAFTDSVSGGSSTMTNALTYGAASTDTIVLLSGGSNPPTPVGTEAANPMRIRVLASDGVTPVSGATIGWSANNDVQLSACNAASSCLATTDENGNALTWLTPSIVATSTITATLAPGVYSPAQSVTGTLSSSESSTDIGVMNQYLWIAQGSAVSVPLSARVLSNGAPVSNATVNFKIVSGSGTLSASGATTNSSGYAASTLSIAQMSNSMQVSACVAPGNAPCRPYYIVGVPLANLNLQPVSGAGQISTGQPFQPIAVRVTDSSSPPNPVLGATVTFQTTVLRPGGDSTSGGGETNTTNPAMPVILSVSQSSASSDINGLVSLVPSSGSFNPPLEVDEQINAGTTAVLYETLQVLPAATTGTSPAGPPKIGDPRRRIQIPLEGR